MTTTIAAITSQLAFTPRQVERVQQLLYGRGVDPYHYFVSDVLDACRQVEREDGWCLVVDGGELYRMALRAGMLALEVAQVQERLGPAWYGRYEMVDVIAAFADVEAGGWERSP